MVKIAVAGAAGRMGRMILGLAAKDKNFQIAGALESPNHPALGQEIGALMGVKPLGIALTSDLKEGLKNAEVLIDFTHPSATAAHLKAAAQSKVGYVIGTTGLPDETLAQLKTASTKIPIVQSPNMSVGVNLLFKLCELTAKALDESYDIEISETHHRMKKDSPSGTAMKLLEVLAKARKKDIKKDTVYGREGEVGARPKGEIGVLAMRGGDVVGDHTVFFFGDGERIELTHRASSREAFASGALKAGKFIAGRKSGLYNMLDVLQID